MVGDGNVTQYGDATQEISTGIRSLEPTAKNQEFILAQKKLETHKSCLQITKKFLPMLKVQLILAIPMIALVVAEDSLARGLLI